MNRNTDSTQAAAERGQPVGEAEALFGRLIAEGVALRRQGEHDQACLLGRVEQPPS